MSVVRPTKKQIYGRVFDLTAEDDNGNQIWDDLGIEMWCIKQTDEFRKANGTTLQFHFENCRRLIWPHLDDHRWHRVCRDEILNNKVTVLLGCGSSGKTHEAAWAYLVDYWCFPEITCVLVCSTDIRGLRKRVWGEITMLWEQGVERFPKLPGHLLDSAIAITTDNIDDCEPGERKTRDMRKGIFGVPCVQGGKFVGLSKFLGIKQKRMRLIADEACFPAGTLVDTPSGKIPIQNIKPGDLVFGAAGASKVRHAMKKSAPSLVKIKALDGREVLCTPTHPLFTQKGWVCACELNQSHYMLSSYEAVQILRGKIQSGRQSKTMSALSPQAKNLRTVREEISTKKTSSSGSILRTELQVEMGGFSSSKREAVPEVQGFVSNLWKPAILQQVPWLNAAVSRLQKTIRSYQPRFDCEILRAILCFESTLDGPGLPQEILLREQGGEDWKIENKNAQGSSGICRSVPQAHYGEQLDGRSRTSSATEPHLEGDGAQAAYSRRQWDWKNEGGKDAAKNSPGVGLESCYKNTPEVRQWLPDMLQGGRCDPGPETGCRSRRPLSQLAFPKGARREENEISNGSWVDSVEIHKQEDSGTTGSCEGRVDVYNLEIERHPSYSVNGFLVHNSMMGENFLSAFANLNKNEDFRAIVLGNPNDPLDPLGRAAEPREGWTDDYLEPKETRVWDTRFMGGRCVNLIGTNSPNFDFPADQPTRYKYLISREKIADTLSFFPKDSMEYYSQCVGSMKIGTIARRVLSRKLCIVNKAQEDVVWLGSDRIKVYFVDAAYGGDRCMAGWAEFGKAIDGVQILSFEEPKIIPILVGDQYPTPEYQIAEVVKEDCESNDIPGDCMGHDSTGRGALGTALAKVWSADTHPIDAGGRPTKRPVSLDITVLDEDTKQKRPKRCDEEYDRLTSEFNFQVSMAVESSQIRNLPEECMEEFCLRRWTRVKGDKKSVEPKDKQHADPEKKGFKQRVGRSPDAADWAAGIVEMARRKGFIITKLGAGIVGSDENKSRVAWLKRHAELTALNKSRQLQATG